jgi:hypothetical protein
MATPMITNKENKESQIVIDLEDELGVEQMESFRARSEEAGAESLTEHFKDIFLRVPAEEKAS